MGKVSPMKAIVLAAGEGTRLRPLTLTKPKALLPVGNIPVIQHVLEALKKNGVKEILIVVGYLKEKIQGLVGDGKRFGLKVNYVLQNHVRGTGEALNLASNLLDKTFLLVYGDLYVTSSAIKKVLQTYKKRRSNVLALVEVENPSDYGVVKIDEKKRLIGIEEKPKKPQTNLVNAGIYVFTEEIFGEIAKTRQSIRGEIELTDAVQSLAQKTDVYTVKLNGDEWVDLGKPWDLLKANEKFLGKMRRSMVKGKIGKNVKIKGVVRVEANAVLRDGVYVEGPIIVGAGSDVGPNCYLRAYTCLGRNVRVGAGCEIKNCVVMNGTKIPHLSYFGDSIIGENCNFGAGTLVANLRFDGKNVKTEIKGRMVDTGRRKFGVVVGDNVQTGINVSLMPGVKIGSNSQIGPNICVYRDIPANTKAILRQTLSFESLQP